MSITKVISLIIITIHLNVEAQELLTLSKAFEMAALSSPDLEQSAIDLAQSQENLKAIEASLKSDFSLQLNPFDFSNQLKYDDRPGGDGWYNVQRTTSGGLFSISQPILLTDATLGLSNKFQWQDMNGDKSFYNSLRLTLDQPLFVQNKQKMAYKEVQLEVENAELNYCLQKLRMERLSI